MKAGRNFGFPDSPPCLVWMGYLCTSIWTRLCSLSLLPRKCRRRLHDQESSQPSLHLSPANQSYKMCSQEQHFKRIISIHFEIQMHLLFASQTKSNNSNPSTSTANKPDQACWHRGKTSTILALKIKSKFDAADTFMVEWNVRTNVVECRRSKQGIFQLSDASWMINLTNMKPYRHLIDT